MSPSVCSLAQDGLLDGIAALKRETEVVRVGPSVLQGIEHLGALCLVGPSGEFYLWGCSCLFCDELMLRKVFKQISGAKSSSEIGAD